MHPTPATATRILAQLRRDPRTVTLLVVVPVALIGLLAWIYAGAGTFDRAGAPLLGVFPFVVMFLVTSVVTLRERATGTLERLLTMPVRKGDLLGGYALAFGAVAGVQAMLATAFATLVCGLDTAGPAWLLLPVAVVDAWLGMALGLLASAFARTEFQAVQFMPAIVLPQFLLCGLLIPRSELPDPLHAVSSGLPLSYAIDAMTEVTRRADPAIATDLLVVAACCAAAIAAGAATLRRRTA
jgi:ABC-2 type transport system permease protein